MKQLLLKQKYEEVMNEDEADVVIVNTCTVKSPTQNKILRYIHDLGKKRIIIAGCMVSTNKEQLTKLFKTQLVSCDNIFDIVKIVKKELKESIKPKHKIKINKESISKNEVVEIIPICQGCLGNCSYCATRFARGELYSYPIKEIITHMEKALKRGVKEFYFTAEDTGTYGLDINSSIVELLKRAILVEGDFKIRIGMMNPIYAYKYMKELGELLKSPKLFKFLHLPIQSGSDKILKLMNRKYTITQIKEVVNYLKNTHKDLTIITDIIVGFPNETEKDFQDTINLMKELRFDNFNISKFWKRPNTIASKMSNQVSSDEKKDRAKKAMSSSMKISEEINKSYLGKILNVLVDEKNKSRSDNYKLVWVKSTMGKQIKVKITDYNSNSLIGKEL